MSPMPLSHERRGHQSLADAPTNRIPHRSFDQQRDGVVGRPGNNGTGCLCAHGMESHKIIPSQPKT